VRGKETNRDPGASFGAKDFCRLTGVSAETLRHYVESGILDPSRAASNNYSKYSALDAVELLYVRMCRGLGLSLPSVLEKGRMAIDRQEDILAGHLAALEEEESRLRLHLARTMQQRELLMSIKGRIDRVNRKEASEVPPLYRIPLVGPGAPGFEVLEPIVKAWMRNPEYTFVMFTAPASSLAGGGTDSLPVTLSLGMNEGYLKQLGLSSEAPVVRIPNSTNYGTFIVTRDPLRLGKPELARVLAEIGAQGMTVGGDLIGRLCTYRDGPEGRDYFLTINIPVG
jgi:DNA-binding transcriptional MerR regulator